MTPKQVLLIDGTSLMYRAFYAIRHLSGPEGQPTNAVFGFMNMLIRLLNERQPDYLAVAFDRGAPQYRLDLYPEYKGHRPDMPEDLRPQFQMAKDLLSSMDICFIDHDGIEADDTLGTLATRFAGESLQVAIVTGDKDLFQLINDHVRILFTRRGISEMDCYDHSRVLDEYGITPERLIDMKGLMGDASDNIPGIPGVGEKTALKLLKQYGTLEDTLAHTEDVPGKKLKENLVSYADQARLSKELATIHREVALDIELAHLSLRRAHTPEVAARFRSLGFDSLLERLGLDEMAMTEGESGHPVPKIETLPTEGQDPVSSSSAEEICSRWEALLTNGGAVDYVFSKGQLEYVLVGNAEAGVLMRACGMDSEVLRDCVRWLLQQEGSLIVHGGKELLVWAGVTHPKSTLFDVELVGYLLDPSRNSYPLHLLVQSHLGESVASDEQVRETPDDSLLASRLWALWHLRDELCVALDSAGLTALFTDIETPLTPILARMQLRGVPADGTVLQQQGVEMGQEMEELSETIWKEAGHPFNLNSPKQLGEVLFEEMGLPVIKRTKTGYSSDAEVLTELAPKHPIAEQMLRYRTLAKLQGYVSGLQAAIDPKSGRIHSTLHQVVTATGRLSSSDPNLQNIPIRDALGRQLRRAFVAPEGYQMLAADYSQIELRILAHLSGSRQLLEAFQRGEDIHRRTASEVFGVPLESVTSEQRSAAKAVNFGIIYGISGYGLSRNLHIDQATSQRYIDEYLARLEGVQDYMDASVEWAREEGLARTLLGRIRYIPEINDRVWHRRRFAERVALNTPIQGSASDIIKKAMVDTERFLATSGLEAHLILQVHDELIWEVKDADLNELVTPIRSIMENVIELEVPLQVDLKSGDNWYDMIPTE